MLKDFEILEYSFDDTISIIGLADLHIGASSCMYKEIKETIDMIKQTPNMYVILNGDILDNGILVGKNLGVMDNTMQPMEQIKTAIELLQPIKDRILLCNNGNHEARLSKISGDFSPLMLVCSELGISDKYRNNMGILKIKIGQRNEKHRATYIVMAHHGKTSAENATKKGHDFANEFEGCDLLLLSHTHAPRIAKYNKKVIDGHNNKVINKELTIAVTNSFLDDCDYSLKGMYAGTSKALVTFDLLKRHNKKIIAHME